MQVNYNLQAASYESPYKARERIENSAPRQTLIEYTASRQVSRPGSAVFGNNEVPQGLSPKQLCDSDDAKQASRKQIREAMGNSTKQCATHIRLYTQFMLEKGERGQALLARA